MPVSMTPPPPPDNRMAELDALLAGKPVNRGRRQASTRRRPEYLIGLAAELRARAVARAAHARECRARLRKERRQQRTAAGLGAPDPPSDGAFRREYRTLLFENISVRFRARKGISVSCGRNVTRSCNVMPGDSTRRRDRALSTYRAPGHA